MDKISQEHAPNRESPAELFVLNLESALVPKALKPPVTDGYRRYMFFLTKREESGRVRFHSHLGFFKGEAEAIRCLEQLRKAYPWAWVGKAHANCIQDRVYSVAASGEQKAVFWKTVRNLANSTVEVLPPQHNDAVDAKVKELSVVEQKRTLKTGVVLAVRRGDAACKALSATKYTVQLRWSVLPIDLDNLPEHALFDAYTLYLVQGELEGRKWYALKLGFFSNPDAAKTVAKYLRSEFHAPAIIPVAREEWGQVEDLVAKNQLRAAGTAIAWERGKRELVPEEVSLLLDERTQEIPAPLPALEVIEDTCKTATA